MLKVGFITCADLARFKVSLKNSLFTHDDQLACDYLVDKNIHVEPVVWGSDIKLIKQHAFDLLIIRSPWDYWMSESHTRNFFNWLKELEDNKIRVANNYAVVNWNLDKHYLHELNQHGVKILPTEFLEPEESHDKLYSALKAWSKIVVKPCVSAGARDTYLLKNLSELEAFMPNFSLIRDKRSFMIQPFVDQICTEGEWSLVFLNQVYSHAVLKKPQFGNWLVQDELGGSVSSGRPSKIIIDAAQDIFDKLKILLNENLLYARVDILPGLFLGELELFEPELFFLDRRINAPNLEALDKFYQGVLRFVK